MRLARPCYDHLAGRLGVSLLGALIDRDLVVGGDGRHHADWARDDRLSAPGRDVAYRLTHDGRERLTALGLALPDPGADGTVALRYCVD